MTRDKIRALDRERKSLDFSPRVMKKRRQRRSGRRKWTTVDFESKLLLSRIKNYTRWISLKESLVRIKGNARRKKKRKISGTGRVQSPIVCGLEVVEKCESKQASMSRRNLKRRINIIRHPRRKTDQTGNPFDLAVHLYPPPISRDQYPHKTCKPSSPYRSSFLLDTSVCRRIAK